MAATADQSPLDAAVKRLALALDALDAAVERRRETDRKEEGLAAQVHMLSADRSQLAANLDAETARGRALEANHTEIARRIDVAMETIRGVIESNDRP